MKTSRFLEIAIKSRKRIIAKLHPLMLASLGRRAVLSAVLYAVAPLRTPAADITGDASRKCNTVSTSSYTLVTCKNFGLTKDNRLSTCAADESCISTSAVRNPSKYAPPWKPVNAAEIADATRAWRAVVSAVTEEPGLKIVEQDDGARYLRATGAATVPTDGVDDVEFIMRTEGDRADVLLYRSATRQSLFLYPLQQPVANQKSHELRLSSIRQRMGWEQAGLPSDGEYLANEMKTLYDVPTATRWFGIQLGGGKAPGYDDDD